MPDGPVVVTGATGLIGKLLAAAFVEEGSRVIGVARDTARLAVVRDALGDGFEPLAIDLSVEGAPTALADRLAARPPQIVIHAARDAQQLALGSGAVTREQWLTSYALEVAAPYELVTALAAAPDSRLRSVILVGSMYGVVAPTPALYDDFATESAPHYGTGKAAVAHLAKELAVRLAPAVRVNAVSYGGVRGRADAEFEARYGKLTPLGRMLDERDIAGPALFLASDAAAGITGHNLVVDGGWSVS